MTHTHVADTVCALGSEQLERFYREHPYTFHTIFRHLVAWFGRRNFWFFVRHVLGNPVLYEPLHRPMADGLHPGNWRKLKKLFLLPRGHVKSNLVTVAYTLWEIVRNPNIRILICSHKVPDASKFLMLVRRLIESPRFRLFYPEIRKAMGNGNKPVRWSDHAIRVERDSELTEDTVQAAGIGATVTGRHYDLIINDDLVTIESVENSTSIEKTKELHELVESLLDPGAREIVIGTRYDYDDEYGRIINTPELAEQYEILVSDIVKPQFSHLPMSEWTDEMLVYPTRYTMAKEDYKSPDGDPTKNKKSVWRVFRVQGPYTFNCQNRNNPQDSSRAVFTREDIQFIPALPEDREYDFFQVTDLSSEQVTRDSFTVIATGAVDDRCNIFITDIFREQCSPMTVIDELIAAQTLNNPRLRPIKVGMEPGPYERALKPWLDKAMSNRGVFIPVSMLPTIQAQKTKEERIRGLQPFVAAGKFYILQTCRNANLLLEELLRFPAARLHLDIADACAQIPHIMFPGRIEDALCNDDRVPRQEMTHEEKIKRWFHRQFENALNAEDPEIFIGNDRVISDHGSIPMEPRIC